MLRSHPGSWRPSRSAAIARPVYGDSQLTERDIESFRALPDDGGHGNLPVGGRRNSSLAATGSPHKRLLEEGDLASDFKEVDYALTGEDAANDWIAFEQQSTVSYTGRPTDVLMDVVKPLKSRLWRIITTGPEQGYRKYYVHLTPPGEQRLPQIASLWVLMYYFGSVVRYRPHEFDTIVRGRYGAFVSEFISALSEQLLYMLASEMCRREVAKPAVI